MKPSFSFLLICCLSILSSEVNSQVIYELYGAGGNSGATWKHDFVILKGTANASLVGYSIQYASTSGTTWSKVDLTGSFNSNGYYVIQLAGGSNGSDLYTFTIDQTSTTINMAVSNGKLALVNNTTTITSGTSCPSGGSIVDFVGFGTANCFEGSAAATGLSTTTSIRRDVNGTDSNDNDADFSPNSPALPVTLKGFSVSVNNSTTLLSFSTATETNNSHFVIERSADARVFSEIGQVRGAGTMQEPQSYTYTDERPLAGINYYRLRQVDYDGTESFSPVVSVVFGKQDRITLAPSPATDRVRIHLDEALRTDGLWQVYDNTGRQVLSGAWEAETADYELDVNTLPEGMYTFRLVVGASVQVKQFRKM